MRKYTANSSSKLPHDKILMNEKNSVLKKIFSGKALSLILDETYQRIGIVFFKNEAMTLKLFPVCIEAKKFSFCSTDHYRHCY